MISTYQHVFEAAFIGARQATATDCQNVAKIKVYVCFKQSFIYARPRQTFLIILRRDIFSKFLDFAYGCRRWRQFKIWNKMITQFMQKAKQRCITCSAARPDNYFYWYLNAGICRIIVSLYFTKNLKSSEDE